MTTIAPAAERYNLDESNYLSDPNAYHQMMRDSEDITLAGLAALGGRITRVRILAGRWGSTWKADVSYIHGIVDGPKSIVDAGARAALARHYRVIDFPATNDLYGPRGVKADFIAWAREVGVFAKGIGLLDEANWSVLKG